MSNEKYKEFFERLWDAHIQQGGNITRHPGLIDTKAARIRDLTGCPVADRPHEDNATAAELSMQERMKACFMLSGADKDCHTSIKNHCEDMYTMGCDEYPGNTMDLLLKMNNFHQQEELRKPSHCVRGP